MLGHGRVTAFAAGWGILGSMTARVQDENVGTLRTDLAGGDCRSGFVGIVVLVRAALSEEHKKRRKRNPFSVGIIVHNS